MANPIRIGLVGVGKIARDQHLPVVAKNGDFELAAVVSSRGGHGDVPDFRTPAELFSGGPPLDAVSLCMPPGQNQVMFLGESTWPGRVFKLTLDGKVVGVIGASGRNLKQFSGAHALACPSENEIYVAESSNWRVQKILLHPQRP